MKPILYAPTETAFTSQGLGTLTDAISCTVTEERNGKYELEMKYPVTGIHFEEIRHSCIILAVPSDGADTQPFRIYRITKPMSGTVTINAEHVRYQMAHIPVKPFTATSVGTALVGLTNNALESCPFTFWTDKSVTADFAVTEPVSMGSRLGGTAGSILDVYGGEWEFDRYTAKLHTARGQNRGVVIRYGKNLMDLQQDENIANTYTGIAPYWTGMDNAGQTVLVTLTEGVLHSANASNFPYNRTIPVALEFASQPTEAQLRAKAQAYITDNNIGVPAVSIKVSFAALWQSEEYADRVNLERVKLCDTVTVEFEKLGVSAQAKVVKTVYDVLLERYDTIEVGDTRSTLASTIADTASTVASGISAAAVSDKATKSMLSAAKDALTAQITAANGGTVVIKYDANDKPTELVILGNSDDISTATDVWRWNRNGLAHSSTGYNGTYTTGITADGHIVADFVDTGTLNASLVKAGVLADVSGNMSWNLVSGALTAKQLSIDSTNFQLSAAGEMVADEAQFLQRIRLWDSTVSDTVNPYLVVDPYGVWLGANRNTYGGVYFMPATSGQTASFEVGAVQYDFVINCEADICIRTTNEYHTGWSGYFTDADGNTFRVVKGLIVEMVAASSGGDDVIVE